jgi:hypothetical protein
MTSDRTLRDSVNRRRPRTRVRLPETLSALVVTGKPRRRRPRRKPKDLNVSLSSAGSRCIWQTNNPTSVITNRGVDICKYTVAGDANSSDSVSFEGGPTVVDITLVPIFYGSEWLISSPSYTEVMNGIATILDSPYLSQLDQYGFHSLSLKRPVLEMVANPPSRHSTDNPGDIVWDLIDNDVFPEPDDTGGHNIYMVFYPPNTSVSNPSYCAWHSQYWDYDFPFDVDWAWVGAVDFPVGNTSSQILDNIIKLFTHELVEILTDPEASGGWTMDRTLHEGSEIADACNNTADHLRGFLVNAYWSERHKACIIPKPTVHATVQITDTVTSSTVIASGVVNISRPVCLRGTYSWTISSINRRIVMTATPPPRLQSPVFVWQIEDAIQGITRRPINLADGFSGIITLVTNTWYQDVTGTSMEERLVSVGVKVNGGTLTLTTGSASDTFSFMFRAHVSVSEAGITPASADIDYRVDGEVFSFDPSYYQALVRCRIILFESLHKTLQRVPRSAPADLNWIWHDQLSSWITGDRLLALAQIASGCAAIENFKPRLAHEMRVEAALIEGVPSQMLLPTCVKRGVTQ